MSSVVIKGDTSGQVTLDAPAIAGTTVLTLPTTSGTLVTNANGDIYPLTSGTAVASTSGTAIDFTGIPSWVKRITVMFNGVSTNGSSIVQIQVGSGSFSTSGYSCTASHAGGSGQYTFASTGFICEAANTAAAGLGRSGVYQLSLLSSNTWVGFGNLGSGSLSQVTNACAGNSPTLGGTLDRIRITTVNGTDTYDAGSINILYE